MGVGNCVNAGVFYAKEVPSQGRNNLSLHPLHTLQSLFSPLTSTSLPHSKP